MSKAGSVEQRNYMDQETSENEVGEAMKAFLDQFGHMDIYAQIVLEEVLGELINGK